MNPEHHDRLVRGNRTRLGLLESLESRYLLTSNLVADFGGIYPTDAAELNGISYFAADDGVHGRELWRSDGTPAGTYMVADLAPGEATSEIYGVWTVGNQLVFGAEFAIGSRSLWRSDGTATGTRQIAAVAPSDNLVFGVGGYDSQPQAAVINDKLVYAFQDRTVGSTMIGFKWELWASDGTAAGTQMIESLGIVHFDRILVLGDVAVFKTNYHLWATDGTVEGTSTLAALVEEVGPAANFMVFTTNGSVLWKTDGTETGTVLLAPGQDGLTSGGFTSFGSKFLFQSDDYLLSASRLLITDGTPAGTLELSEMPDGQWNQSAGAAVGDKFLLPVRVTDWQRNTWRLEIWQTDGTIQGTYRVTTITENGEFSSWTGLVTVQDQAFFVTSSYSDEVLLWRTDGTVEGTRVVQELTGGGGASLKEIDGRLAILNYYGNVTAVYDPAASAMAVGPVQGAISLKDGVLRVHGTRNDDFIRIYHHTSAADRFVVNLNGVKKSFPIASVSRIYIYGYSGNDNLSFYDGYGRVSTRSRIWSGPGNDIVYTGLNRDTVYGDAGDDSLNTGHNDDILMGGDGDDLLNAGVGNDTASGEGGSDHVNGGAGSDMLSGGTDGSEDWIDGGAGADVLFGQAVIDTFFSQGDVSLVEELLEG